MLDSERYISNAASEPISAFLPYIWPYIFMQRAATFSDDSSLIEFKMNLLKSNGVAPIMPAAVSSVII